MPKFGKRSRDSLATCHPDLVRLFEEVVKTYDCSVLCGRRGERAQNEAYAAGLSTKKYPDSNHNAEPLSNAADVVPYPIDWKDLKRFYHFSGYVQAVADRLGIPIRWGGDWDSDRDLNDQRFFDLPHFERRRKCKNIC